MKINRTNFGVFILRTSFWYSLRHAGHPFSNSISLQFEIISSSILFKLELKIRNKKVEWLVTGQ